MKKRFFPLIALFSAWVVGSMTLIGCASDSVQSQNITTPDAAPTTPGISNEETSDPEVPSPSPEIDTKKITITVLNLSSTDIGMFSIIDPVLDEQTDINPLTSDGTLSFECDWPITITEFQWAVYDTNGEILIESSTDISACEEKLSILLSGDETIDDVNVLFN